MLGVVGWERWCVADKAGGFREAALTTIRQFLVVRLRVGHFSTIRISRDALVRLQ